MNRTVEIRVAEDCKIIPLRKSTEAAIGYLSMWGNSDRVLLYIDKDYNIDVSHQHIVKAPNPYNLPEPRHQQYYFIMGLYDKTKDSYSFHS